MLPPVRCRFLQNRKIHSHDRQTYRSFALFPLVSRDIIARLIVHGNRVNVFNANKTEKFLSFYQEITVARRFLFYIISSNYDPFCYVVHFVAFHRLGFTFVRRYIVARNAFAKERYFPDNLIER